MNALLVFPVVMISLLVIMVMAIVGEASSVYYKQCDMFIMFTEDDVITVELFHHCLCAPSVVKWDFLSAIGFLE